MRGTFFQKPLELALRVEGERWRQGETVSGTLEARNHGSDAIEAAGLRVRLARGDIKKVRARSPGAFQILAVAPAPEGIRIAPGAAESFPWSFGTDRNFGITDATGSPFLVYGTGEALETLGQIQLPFRPHWVIQEVVSVLETVFRFVPKGERHAKAGAPGASLEIRFAPPDSKAFATLDQLVLAAGFDGDALSLGFRFQMKKIEATAASFEVTKGKREATKRLSSSEYLLTSGRIHPERLEAAIREALSEVERKVFF